MGIAVLAETPGMTAAQFDTVAAELGLRDSLPEGCLVHIAGPGPGGSTWRDVSVWETPEQAKRYMDETFRPAIERVGAKVIWGPPENWAVHELIVSH